MGEMEGKEIAVPTSDRHWVTSHGCGTWRYASCGDSNALCAIAVLIDENEGDGEHCYGLTAAQRLLFRDSNRSSAEQAKV